MLPVQQRYLDVDHGVVGEDARVQRLPHTLLHRRDVLAGDGAADDLVLEPHSDAARLRLHLQLDDAKLAAATRLTDEPSLGPRRLEYGLLVGHLRATHVGLHVELPQHPVDDDLQMQLAHAGDDRLAGLGVVTGAERGVLLAQAQEGLHHAVLVVLGLGFDGHGNDRLRKLDRFQQYGPVLSAECVAREGALEPHRGRDVSGLDVVDVLTAVGVHSQDTAQALSLTTSAVLHGSALFGGAGVDTEVDQTPDVGISYDLEGKAGERLIVAGVAFQQFARLGVGPRDGRNLDR